MPQLYNRHHKNAPDDAEYIGRGTPWGNPFSHIAGLGIFVTTRDAACDAFETRVADDYQFQQKIKEELRGKDLVCSCVPNRCHGETLIRIANEE